MQHTDRGHFTPALPTLGTACAAWSPQQIMSPPLLCKQRSSVLFSPLQHIRQRLHLRCASCWNRLRYHLPSIMMCSFFFFISRGFVVGECFRKAWEIEFFWQHGIAEAVILLCILMSHQQPLQQSSVLTVPDVRVGLMWDCCSGAQSGARAAADPQEHWSEKTREMLILQDNLRIVCVTSATPGKRTET